MWASAGHFLFLVLSKVEVERGVWALDVNVYKSVCVCNFVNDIHVWSKDETDIC